MIPVTRQRHVLVVDDDFDLRDSVMEALADEGYSVAGASDGVAALEYLRTTTQRPDLIVLDLNMPMMGGAEFRAKQLEDAKHAGIPIVLVSGEANVTEKTTALQAAGFIRKPFDVDGFIAVIARVLQTQE